MVTTKAENRGGKACHPVISTYSHLGLDALGFAISIKANTQCHYFSTRFSDANNKQIFFFLVLNFHTTMQQLSPKHGSFRRYIIRFS